eukprot:Nitzschia sp. Nitz4//scaffold191_size41780//34025//34756//NITZ4_007476-RA/size41780-processed-gene-0.37-mRNA-1//1//CDS//3329540208//6023//frame0
MLMCHAYAFQQNMTYGGACVRDWTQGGFRIERKRAHKALIKAVGLSGVLKFRCPPSEVTNLTEPSIYRRNDTSILTPEYIEYLQSVISYPPKTTNTRQIAVHIRRGDVTPCFKLAENFSRYLPNQHFMNLIDRYNPENNSKVVIYSETESFESFDDFRDRGYDLALDGDITDVWKGMIQSDVVILSRSSFSLVPAILSKGTVVYTPFWHKPLAHWDVVEDSLVNESTKILERFRADNCPPKRL